MNNQKKLQKHQDVALENKKLRETLDEYQQEFSSVKNQEVTIKQLRERVKELDGNMANSVEGRCKEIERQLAGEFAEKERELVKDKVEAFYRLSEVENRLSAAEKKLIDSQSELFQMKNKFDEFAVAKSSEIDLLISENERNNERLSQWESQSATSGDSFMLHQQKSTDKSIDANNSLERSEICELEMELHSKENEIMKLNEDKRNLTVQFAVSEKSMQTQLDQSHAALTANQRLISELQTQMQSHSDYEEIKKELFIIKSIEFQEFQQSDNGDSHPSSSSSLGPADNSVPHAHTKSIEQLVNEKNRHLQNELLQMKASFTHVKMELDKLTDEDEEKRIKLHEQSQLINQLEDDLRNMKTFQPPPRKGQFQLSVEFGENVTTDGTERVGKVKEATMLADVLEHNDDHPQQSGASDGSGPNSLLAIVQSQRDRFKTRSQELEANFQLCQQTLQNLQQENEQIRTDNVKLYEKVRFLQSYSRSSKSPYEDAPIMSRYSGEYEANINPFQMFNRHEKQRQYQALPPHEKIVLGLGKFVMGNRTARIFAFLYSLLLHFLIFIVLYKLAYTETCVRDQAFQCRKEFAEHMKMAHGK